MRLLECPVIRIVHSGRFTVMVLWNNPGMIVVFFVMFWVSDVSLRLVDVGRI